nr:farnesyl diphosphate synthase [Anticarsia gemmatalis]
MNKIHFLRLINKTRPFYKCSGLLQQLAKRSYSAEVRSPKKDTERFRDAWPSVINSLLTSPRVAQLPEVGDWMKKVIEHNVSGGKLTRGCTTMIAYEMMEKPENITEEYIYLSKVLGWCIEMIQGYFCILDDVMDSSSTRRGSPCWHVLPDVGMGALNDSVLMSSSIMQIIETHFFDTPHYADIVRVINESILLTSMGQHLDWAISHRKKGDYSQFTIKKYEEIAQYKASYYTFRLPTMLALTLVKDLEEKGLYVNLEEIFILIGKLYQTQDDYIDCFGDETLTGKAGTDIQEGRCNWFAATALEKCNEEQKQIFVKHYGSKDPGDVARIKKLYEDLCIPELYKLKEIEIHDEITRRIRALPSEKTQNYLFVLLNSIYKRDR